MNLAEVTRALRQLRVSGMAATLEARLLQAQSEKWAAIDFISALVQDELIRRQDRLLERRIKQAEFRDAGKTLDTFDFDFNKKMDRRLVFELAAGHFVEKREDVLFLDHPAAERVTSPKPSVTPLSGKVTRCCTVRRTSSWRSSPRPPWTEHGRTGSSNSLPSRSSSSMIWACASFRPQRPRTCSSW